MVSIPFVSDGLEDAVNIATSMVDTTGPTSSSEIEGKETKIVVGAVLGGFESDLNGNITGVEVLSAGGGVYRTATTVITVREVFGKISKVLQLPDLSAPKQEGSSW